MSAIKKMFGSGDDRDSEVMYQTEGGTSTTSGGTTQASQGLHFSSDTGGSTALDNTDRAIQSDRDIGTGAESNPGFVSKAADTSNVQSQTGGTTSATSAAESQSGLHFASSGGDTTSTPATQGGSAVTYAEGATASGAAAATGATVFASDRAETTDSQDDISKATYTERSYPLSDNQQSVGDRSSFLESSRPLHEDTDHYHPSSGTTGGATSATESSLERPLDQDHSHLSQNTAAGGDTSGAGSSLERPLDQDHSHLSRDAAIGGVAAAGAGAVGYGAYEATRDTDTSQQTTSQPTTSQTTTSQQTTSQRTVEGSAIEGSHKTTLASLIDPRVSGTDTRTAQGDDSRYGLDRNAGAVGATTAVGTGSGVGAYAATRGDDTTTSVVDPRGIDQQKIEQTESHYGRDAAAVGAVTGVGAGAGAGAGYAATQLDDSSRAAPTTTTTTTDTMDTEGKKQGFFSKVFKGDRNEEKVDIGDETATNEVGRVAQPGGSGGQVGDDGMITFVNEGVGADAPVLVVREKPGGGIETLDQTAR